MKTLFEINDHSFDVYYEPTIKSVLLNTKMYEYLKRHCKNKGFLLWVKMGELE